MKCCIRSRKERGSEKKSRITCSNSMLPLLLSLATLIVRIHSNCAYCLYYTAIHIVTHSVTSNVYFKLPLYALHRWSRCQEDLEQLPSASDNWRPLACPRMAWLKTVQWNLTPETCPWMKQCYTVFFCESGMPLNFLIFIHYCADACCHSVVYKGMWTRLFATRTKTDSTNLAA